MDKLGLNLGALLFYTFNFIIVLLVLYALAYRPILRALEARRQKVNQGLEDAQAAAEARASAEQEAARIRAEAQADAARILREASARAEQVAEEIRRNAEAEAEEIRREAVATLEDERNRMLADLRGQVAAIAIAAAQKLLGEMLDERRQRALLDEFFSTLQAGDVVSLREVIAGADVVEIVSALPLNAQEKEKIRQNLLDHSSRQVQVSFRVDPTILGGLIVRAGGKVLDGSLAGQLASLRQTLQ